jgi:LCP family protein required for cell wall assembly
MLRPRRRSILMALAVVCVLIAAMGVQLAWQWKRAYDNVNAMIVPTVVLPPAPTEAPMPTATVAARAANQPPAVVPTVPPTPQPTAIPSPDGPVNILLMGTDARPGDEFSRTDTMIVVHIDPRSDRISMLSLPRDLLVSVPQFGQHNINAAYPIGEKELGKGYGAALAKATVGKLLGIQIDYFMLVNFDGFKTLIDRLGGIYVDVPKVINDPAYPTDDYRTIKVHFDPGMQLMNGNRALIYARTRHADNDFGRIERQQQVLMAIFNRVRDQGLLTQITSLDDYTDALRDSIRTDMPRSEMLSLATLGPRLSADNIERFAIRPPLVVEQLQPTYALLLRDRSGLRKLVDQMMSGTMAAGGEDVTR